MGSGLDAMLPLASLLGAIVGDESSSQEEKGRRCIRRDDRRRSRVPLPPALASI